MSPTFLNAKEEYSKYLSSLSNQGKKEKENEGKEEVKRIPLEKENEAKEEVKHGIPLERITNRNEKEEIIGMFTCQICKQLARDMQIDKGECESAFCRECLQNFWDSFYNKNKCPLKCSNSQFGPPSRTDKIHLKGLFISCQFKEQGCIAIVSYEDLNSHESSCQFLPVKCQAYNSCKTEGMKSKMAAHEESCEFVLTPCQSCKQSIQRKDLSTHNCIAHLLTLLEAKDKQASERPQKFHSSHETLVRPSIGAPILLNHRDEMIQILKNKYLEAMQQQSNLENKLQTVVKATKEKENSLNREIEESRTEIEHLRDNICALQDELAALQEENHCLKEEIMVLTNSQMESQQNLAEQLARISAEKEVLQLKLEELTSTK